MFIVYRIDNHADNRMGFGNKAGATRCLNSRNAKAICEANTALAEVLRRIREYDSVDRPVPADVLADRDDLEKRACGSKLAWAMTTIEDIDKNVVFMRKVKNLMTGEMVDERSDTPYYMSVSSETYWSR